MTDVLNWFCSLTIAQRRRVMRLAKLMMAHGLSKDYASSLQAIHYARIEEPSIIKAVYLGGTR